MKRYSVPHKPSVLWEHGETNFLGRFGDRKNNPSHRGIQSFKNGKTNYVLLYQMRDLGGSGGFSNLQKQYC